MSVLRPRRYCLLKRLAYNAVCESDLALVWQGLQEAEPGTELPAGFPSKAALVAAGYTTIEDVHGATERELADYVALRANQAQAVIAAAADLI